MLDASIDPSAAPAPTSVCKFVDEQDDIVRLNDLLHDDLEPFFELAAVFRPRDQRSQIKGDHAPVHDVLGNIAVNDPLRESLDDRGFSDARFTDDDGIVFRPAGEDLQNAIDFVFPADDRIQFAALCQLREVPAELVKGRSRALFCADLGRCPSQIVDDQLAGTKQIYAETAKDLAADPFFFTDKSEEKVFASDIIVPEEPGFFNCVFKDFFCAGSKGNVAEGEGVSA